MKTPNIDSKISAFDRASSSPVPEETPPRAQEAYQPQHVESTSPREPRGAESPSPAPLLRSPGRQATVRRQLTFLRESVATNSPGSARAALQDARPNLSTYMLMQPRTPGGDERLYETILETLDAFGTPEEKQEFVQGHGPELLCAAIRLGNAAKLTQLCDTCGDQLTAIVKQDDAYVFRTAASQPKMLWEMLPRLSADAWADALESDGGDAFRQLWQNNDASSIQCLRYIFENHPQDRAQNLLDFTVKYGRIIMSALKGNPERQAAFAALFADCGLTAPWLPPPPPA